MDKRTIIHSLIALLDKFEFSFEKNEKRDIKKFKKSSKSNCPAGQELVLHTLEQIPEDERFEAK